MDTPASAIQRALRPLCEEARRRGTRVEQVIVVLKKEWFSLAPSIEPRSPRHADAARQAAFLDSMADAQGKLLDDILRVLIEEYYRT